MNHVKRLSFAAVIAAAVMALVGSGSASATALCSEPLTTACPAGEDYAGATPIEITSTGVGLLTTKEGTILDECEDSTLVGETKNTGSSTETVKIPITTVNWGTCSRTTDAPTLGEFEIHWSSGTDNGTVTVSGTSMTINTVFGTCTYTTSDIGTLVGGNPATIMIEKLPVKKVTGNFACPAETFWTDTFDVNNPKPLYVSAGNGPATALCSEPLTSGCAAAGKDYAKGTVIEATSTGIGILATKEGTILDECEDSTLVGETANTGSSTEAVRAPITALSWGTCSKTTDTIKSGELEINWIAGTDNGTLTVSGTNVTINTIFGTCTYTTSDVGTLVGGNPATIMIEKLPVKKVTGNFACPAETFWTDTFDVKKPNPLYVSTS